MSKKGKTGQSSRKENMKWTEEMDSIFIDAMLEQQTRGFRVDGTFTTAAYNNMIATMQRTLGVLLTKDHLKNRIKTLKGNFSICYELFNNKSGISWSSETKMFQAEDQVWNELIEANHNMRRWRSTPVLNYDKLENLFSKDRATGSLSSSCNDLLHMWRKEDEAEERFDSSNTCYPESSDDSSPIDLPTAQPNTKPCDDSSSLRSGKRTNKDDAEEYDPKKHFMKLIKCIEKTNECLVKQTHYDNEERAKMECSQNKLYEDLKKIGVPSDQLVRAYIILGCDKDKTNLFYAAPEAVRLAVVHELLKM